MENETRGKQNPSKNKPYKDNIKPHDARHSTTHPIWPSQILLDSLSFFAFPYIFATWRETRPLVEYSFTQRR
jgi:hypothetical protein